jgi:hypothetical protein
MFMDATFHGGSNDTNGGRGRLRRPEISPIYTLQLSPIFGVNDTGDKFISPVSLTPLNSLSPVVLTPVININSRISPRIFEKIQNGSIGILGGLGDTDS